MAKVRIKNEGIEIEVADGGNLMEAIQDKCNIPFGCGNGDCGTCMIAVTKGVENLSPQTHKEWDYLKRHNANSPKQRLACQVWVKKGEIEIEY